MHVTHLPPCTCRRWYELTLRSWFARNHSYSVSVVAQTEQPQDILSICFAIGGTANSSAKGRAHQRTELARVVKPWCDAAKGDSRKER